MKPEGSLPHSQEPALFTCREPDQSSLWPHPTSWRFILILSTHLLLGLPSGLVPSGLPHYNIVCISPLSYTWHTSFEHSLRFDGWKLLSSSVGSFLQYPVTSSFLDKNVFIRTVFCNTSASLPHWMWQTKFHTHTKQNAKLKFCIS